MVLRGTTPWNRPAAKAAPPSTASAATPPASTAKGFRRGDGSGPGPPTGNRTTCNGTVGIGMTGGSAGFTGSVGYAAPTTSSAGSGSGSGKLYVRTYAQWIEILVAQLGHPLNSRRLCRSTRMEGMAQESPAPPASPVAADGQPQRSVMVAIGALLLGMLIAALDQTIVSTALPTIVSDLGGMEHLSWVVTAYMLASTAATPLWGSSATSTAARNSSRPPS